MQIITGSTNQLGCSVHSWVWLQAHGTIVWLHTPSSWSLLHAPSQSPITDNMQQFLLHFITSCAARWPPQYAPAPADRSAISGQFVVRGQELPWPMCVPNLKIVAFSICEILRGSQNFEIGSRAAGDDQFRANLWSGGKNCPRPMCMPNLKIVALPICEILRGSQNFEIGSRTPGDAHLGANLWSMGKNCPRPMCVPNLKIVALSVCEILRGSQNFEIWSRTQATPNFGPICGPGARTAHGLCACQIWRA